MEDELVKSNVAKFKTDEFATYTYNTNGNWIKHKDNMVIRVDGKEVKTVGYSHTPQPANKHPIRVGTWHGGSNSHYFNGEIAEIIIWNRSLTQAEMEKEEKRIKN